MATFFHAPSSTMVYMEPFPQSESLLLDHAAKETLEALSPVTSERRRMEILLTHHMVRAIFGESARLLHDRDGAPFVSSDRDVNISVSHSVGHVVMAINPDRRIGIDLETLRPQLQRVSARYLSLEEQSAYGSPLLLLRAWTTKEAVYKAAGTPGLSFADQIRLPLPPDGTTARVCRPGNEIVRFSVTELLPEEHTRSLALAVRADGISAAN